MDISLNISSNSNCIPKANKLPQKINKNKTSSDSGFSFTFTKNDKVKAIVARRRTKPTSLIQKNAEKPQNIVQSPRKSSPIPTARKNYVQLRNFSSDDDEDAQSSQSASNLLLNVVTNKTAPKVNKTTKTISHKKNLNLKPAKSLPVRRNYVQIRKFDTDDDDDDEDDDFNDNNKVENAQDDINLSLNVVKGDAATVKITEQKKKLTRVERLNAQKFKMENSDRVLTTKEINEGIKKFSEIDNKISNKKIQEKKKELFKNNPEIKVIGQRFVKPIEETVFTGVSMDSLNLHPHCVKNLSDLLHITELTLVQQKAIPKALEGKDLLIRSQTGSGKTLAYALPIVQKLQEVRPKLTRNSGIEALIIVPTRELGIQTYELFLKLLKPFTWIVPGLMSGGEKRKSEKSRLRKGINIVIGTPGRLVDHLLHTETFKLDKIKWLILDEADRLLEMGYERDVGKIVDGINQHKAGRFKIDEENTETKLFNSPPEKPESWQRLLLSATLTSAVQKLAGLALVEPLFIDTSDMNGMEKSIKEPDSYEDAVNEALKEGNLVIPSTVKLSYVLVPPKLRLVSLSGLLAKECVGKNFKALVFMSTMEMVNYHHDLMNELLTHKVLDDEEEFNEDEDEDEDDPLLMGLRFYKLHGSMTQTERSGVFKSFRESKSGVLLATDVACRGIDVPEVDLVVQYSPPQKIADFVHRVGRTARAGRSGRAVLFLGPNETDFIRILEDKRIRISQESMDPYLETVCKFNSIAHSAQEAAASLQHKFEQLLKEDKEMYDKACKAFVSWVRFYSTFPRELKQIFNAKTAHMGHYAKSFGLQEAPKAVTKKHTTPKLQPPTNRLTYTERNPEKIKDEKRAKKRPAGYGPNTSSLPNKFAKFLPKSISLTTSEFDSGLPERKKKK